MQQAETIVLLLGLVAALVVIAQKINLPYPVVLVLAGLALSFVPRLPEVKLNPNIVFYSFCRRSFIRRLFLLRGAIFGEIFGRSCCSRSDWS